LNGVPLLSKMGTEWKLLHAYLGACAVCGFELEPGRRVYRLHSCKDAQNIRKAERQHSHDLGGPGHRSCMAFAAFACPYFHGPLSKLGKDSNIDPGSPRGAEASLFGFKRCSLMIFAGAHNPMDESAPQPYFDYQGLVEDHRFKVAEDLANRFDQWVLDDASCIDTSVERAFWTDSPADQQEMKALLDDWRQAITSRQGEPILLFGVKYRSFSIPV